MKKAKQRTPALPMGSGSVSHLTKIPSDPLKASGFAAASEMKREKEQLMPRGDKSSYTQKQKRKAEHIEKGYEKRGTAKKEAERRAWATVNKESGGGKKSGSGRGKKSNKSSSRKGGRKGGKASGKKK
jgi:plasmid stabilization system protein ParE